MKILLEEGDAVTMLPTPKLMEVLKGRNFCTNDKIRQKVADEIGGKEGVVSNIELKYALDYFYFSPHSSASNQYSVPYEAVDFSIIKLT